MVCVFFHEWRNSIEASGRQEQYSNEVSFFKDATCCEEARFCYDVSCSRKANVVTSVEVWARKGAPTSFLTDLGIFVSAV
ncbi:hypothetical protein DEO72_LG1g3158 [Vigna unguiculata]|uniref:Uncharacterized protein n=1 Tax=Vigna unguiculata TaxID=3917 RepID=A0A4D6KN56_VIGUN|nr:hypothetical protein DEO72_LG1g3158 [Vigna unguiculata]